MKKSKYANIRRTKALQELDRASLDDDNNDLTTRCKFKTFLIPSPNTPPNDKRIIRQKYLLHYFYRQRPLVLEN